MIFHKINKKNRISKNQMTNLLLIFDIRKIYFYFCGNSNKQNDVFGRTF